MVAVREAPLGREAHLAGDRFDLEELAALIEGRLKGEARARVVRLLAESDEAYEVFAETLRFQAEERARKAPLVRATDSGHPSGGRSNSS